LATLIANAVVKFTHNESSEGAGNCRKAEIDHGFVLSSVSANFPILSSLVKISTFLLLFLVYSYVSILARSTLKMSTESQIVVIGMTCRLSGGADSSESL